MITASLNDSYKLMNTQEDNLGMDTTYAPATITTTTTTNVGLLETPGMKKREKRRVRIHNFINSDRFISRSFWT